MQSRGTGALASTPSRVRALFGVRQLLRYVDVQLTTGRQVPDMHGMDVTFEIE